MFEFGAFVNSHAYLDCSHEVLAVFNNKMFISGSKFLSLSMKAVVTTCACAVSLDHVDFSLFMFGSHNRNQDENSLTVLF